MANRLFNPDIQFADSTGAPYSGGQLFFYASGTSTKLNTYSDAGLTIANSNPVVLDSAGRAGPIFLQNLQYKVILAPSTDTDPPTSPIWTQDPVYTSDYSAAAQFTGVNGNPNGVLAGSAGSATIKASVAWDYTNDILYVCTTTGTASTAVWTAVNAATAANVVPPPQGRLTLISGTPVMVADVTAATAVYYTPYVGDDVPLYNGTSFVPLSIQTEQQLTLTSSYVASNIYDFYAFLINGVVTFGTGPSWSAGTAGSITAGSCARGTGAGGAALSRVQGILTNAASMTMRYGDGTQTTTIDANKGTYLGTMFVDGTNGQVTCTATYGQSRKWGIWNAYNRVRITLQAGPSTSSWAVASSTAVGPRPPNNDSANKATVLEGLAEEYFSATYSLQTANSSASQNGLIVQSGIGVNSTSAFSGSVGQSMVPLPNTQMATATARYAGVPQLGITVITPLECFPNGTSNLTSTIYGTQQNNNLIVDWRG